jgi:hypothetical protein
LLLLNLSRIGIFMKRQLILALLIFFCISVGLVLGVSAGRLNKKINAIMAAPVPLPEVYIEELKPFTYINKPGRRWSYVQNKWADLELTAEEFKTRADYIELTGVPLAPAVCAATNGAQLQSCLSTSIGGDTIELAYGNTFSQSGSFFIPEKTGSAIITVTTNRPDLLPAKLSQYPSNWHMTNRSQWRITQAEAINMPKMVAIDSGFVMQFQNRADYWTFYGIEFTGVPDVFLQSIINVAGYEATLADVNKYIVLDHLYIHPAQEIGDLTNGFHYRDAEYGLVMGGHHWTIQNCAFQGLAGYIDSGGGTGTIPLNANAIVYGLGEGEVVIQNNLLEATGNTLWLGGGTLGFPFVGSSSTVAAGATATSATLVSMPADPVVVGDLVSLRLTGISDLPITGINDPNGFDPSPLASGYAVGRVESVAGLNITFSQLTSGAHFRRIRIKFNTGVTGGTFTLTHHGQTTAPISFPSQAITGATNASPIEITSAAHGLVTGDNVRIQGVTGNTNANIGTAITVTGANTFTLNGVAGNGTYTGGGLIASRTKLQNNIRAGLEALSNLVPADLAAVDSFKLYVGWDPTYFPSPVNLSTFGTEVWFADSVPLTKAGFDFTINAAGLTGTGSVAGRVEQAGSESYTNVHPSITPDTGATIAWDGLTPDNVTIKRNIIAKQPEWYLYSSKGYGEMKTGRNYLFEANIWYGEYTGMILETKNQGGDAPWSVVEYITFRYNLWTHTGTPIAIAPTDGGNRTKQGNHNYVYDNVFLNAKLPVGGDATFFGNSTTGGTVTEITHNTIINPNRLTFVVYGKVYDGVEVVGFSQAKQWIFRNNIVRFITTFFHGNSEDALPLTPPYDTYGINDVRSFLPDMLADNNVILDDLDHVDVGDSFNFFGAHPTNNYVVETFTDVGFLNTMGPQTFVDPRLSPSSIYAAGNSRDATDGKDMGADIPALISAMGFDPFTGALVTSSVCNWHTNPRCN